MFGSRLVNAGWDMPVGLKEKQKASKNQIAEVNEDDTADKWRSLSPDWTRITENTVKKWPRVQ